MSTPANASSTRTASTVDSVPDTLHARTALSVADPPQPSAPSSPQQQRQQQQQHNNMDRDIGQVCSNCGTTRTPLWRRAPDGATICNACGLYLKARNTSRPVSLKRSSQPAPVADSDACRAILADASLPGTCPGDGHCNGTGGSRACSGCPAFNNRVSKSVQLASSAARNARQQQQHPHQLATQQTSPQQASSPLQSEETDRFRTLSAESLPSNDTAGAVLACQNCSTTITPLWRRDEVGHTICNACGMSFHLISSFFFY